MEVIIYCETNRDYLLVLLALPCVLSVRLRGNQTCSLDACIIYQALVDASDMVRSQMNLNSLSLIDIKIDIKRIPKKKTLIAAMEAADVKTKWESSSRGRKLIVQKRRASLNDFDRFKLMLAKIKRAGVVRQELAKLKKEVAA